MPFPNTHKQLRYFLLPFILLLFVSCTSSETSAPGPIEEPTVGISELSEIEQFPTLTPVIEPTPTLTPAPTATFDAAKFTCSAVSGIPESECDALLHIFSATGGEDWGDNYPSLGEPWASSDKPCEWHGIVCLDGHVSELDLSESQLTDALPTEIVQLEQLDTLVLSRNRLIGELPVVLGQMTWLRSADLSNNKFKGEIPPGYGDMLSLEALNLKYNNLLGEIPPELGSLPLNGALNWLDLSFNPYLDGTIPEAIRELDYFSPEGTSLRRLHE